MNGRRDHANFVVPAHPNLLVIGGRLVPHPGDDGGLGPLVARNARGPGHGAAADRRSVCGYSVGQLLGKVGIGRCEGQEVAYGLPGTSQRPLRAASVSREPQALFSRNLRRLPKLSWCQGLGDCRIPAGQSLGPVLRYDVDERMRWHLAGQELEDLAGLIQPTGHYQMPHQQASASQAMFIDNQIPRGGAFP